MGGTWDMDIWLFDAEGLGNLMVAGCAKHSTNYARKRCYYQDHCSRELRQFFELYPDKVDRQAIDEREASLTRKLIAFFKSND